MRPDRPTLSPETPREREPVGGPQPDSTSTGKPIPRRITPKMMVSVAIRQANFRGSGTFYCPLCKDGIDADEPRILEHMIPRATLIALGQEPDAVENLMWVHKRCADRKTNGTKATSAGSDKHMEAKGKRFDRVSRGERSRTRKGPPLKSRPFPKVHRPMRRPQP